MYLLPICKSSLEKCIFRSSAHYFTLVCFLLLSCMSYLYILEIKLLSVTLFADIFSPVNKLSLFSFAVPQLINLIRSHLVNFAFIAIALGDCPKKSRSFMVSCVILKSLSLRWRSSIQSAKKDQELSVAQIMNSFLPNSDLN